MHICMTTSEFPPTFGGISEGVYKLSKSLTVRGHRVTVITRGSRKGLTVEYSGNLRVYRVPYLHIYPMHVKLQQLFQNQILRSIEDEIDLVHVHHPLSPPVRTSLPIVATIHTSLGPNPERFDSQNYYSGMKLPNFFLAAMRLYFSHIERVTIENADRIVVVSKAVADELVARYGRKITGPIDIMGNGVDTALFAPGVAQSSQSRILFTGRLAAVKGLFDFVKAAQLILKDCPDARFIVTGEGPIKNDLKHLVGDLGMIDRFSFAGYLGLRQFIECYQTSTVYVFPTRYEGLPTSVLEAMACGLPVVTTNIGSMREVIESEQNGVMVPVGDPAAIAKAVLNLLRNDSERVRMGRAARRTVLQRYSWEGVVDRYVNCYEDAIKEKIS